MFARIAALLLAALAARAQTTNATIELRARDAAIGGGGPTKYFTNPAQDCIGHWTSTNAAATWTFDLKERGTFRVVALIGRENSVGDSDFVVEVGDQRAGGTIRGTGGWFTFTEFDLGPVILRKPGPVKVTVRLTTTPRSGAMNLRAIRLIRQD